MKVLLSPRLLFAALALTLLLGAQAQADFTFNAVGPLASDGATLTGTNTTSSSLHSTLIFSGDITEINTGTFASEARFRADTIEYQVSTIGGITGTANLSETLNGVFWAPATVGSVSVDTFESFDDGGDLIADAQWDNIDFELTGSVATIDIGDFVEGAGFVFDTAGSSFDTELGAYDLVGNVVGSNDDDLGGITPQSLLDLGTLSAGDYYLIMGAFNTTYAPGSATTTSALTGDYAINLNGAQVDAGTLAAGGLVTVEFTVTAVPEPSSAVFVLGLAGVFLRRRR